MVTQRIVVWWIADHCREARALNVKKHRKAAGHFEYNQNAREWSRVTTTVKGSG